MKKGLLRVILLVSDPVRISSALTSASADPLALALPKASRSAFASRGFFAAPRLRASSHAAQQKSRPDFVWSAL